MLTTGYLIAIGLFVFGFVILALLWLLNTIETNNYKNKQMKGKQKWNA